MKKLILTAVFVALTTFLSAQDISGDWNWEYDNGKKMTEIFLKDNGGGNFKGYYCSAFYNGRKLDCSQDKNEVCINVQKISNNVFEGTFESPSWGGNGQIRLAYIPYSNKLKFEILSRNGTFYLPNNVYFE